MMWSIFSYGYLPSVYHLWWSVFRSFAYFLIGFRLINLGFLLLSFKFLDRFWIEVFYWVCFSKFFLPVCGLSFYSLDGIFHRIEVCNVNKVQLINCFFHGLWNIQSMREKKPHWVYTCFIGCWIWRATICIYVRERCSATVRQSTPIIKGEKAIPPG